MDILNASISQKLVASRPRFVRMLCFMLARMGHGTGDGNGHSVDYYD